jgi:hypothetical protein
VVINPLTKIIVTSGPLRCKPGSLGYLVRQSQLAHHNVWDRAVMFSKLGKTGKDRLDVACLSGTMIDYRSLKITSKGVDILKNVTLAEGLHPRLHVSDVGKKKPRHGYIIDHTQFDTLKEEHKSALNMPVWEFISYITAMSTLVYSIENKAPARDLADITIASAGAEFYSFPDDIPLVSLVWLFFMHGLKLDKQQKDKAFETRYRKFFDLPAHRVVYMTKLRRALAIMSSQVKKDNNTMSQIESNSRKNIKDILGYYKGHADDYKSTVERSEGMVSAGKHPDIDVKKKVAKKVKPRLRRA